MPDSLQLTVALLTAAPMVLVYFLARFVSRRRLGAVLREPRPWQPPTVQGWLERAWVLPEAGETFPAALPASVVLYEWARADPEVACHWRFHEPVEARTPGEALVRDLWANLPPAERERARERLAGAVREAVVWWGGAERGWNGRPLAVSAAAVSRKEAGLPLLPLPDLTAAPLPLPVQAEQVAEEGDGPDLVLILAALRRSTPRFMHPLAPQTDPAGSMIEGLSTRVGSDLGGKVGAGLGAVLGPIGSMVGRYLGEMAGRAGGKALADSTLPAPVSQALKATEAALVRLGRLAETEAFARAVQGPEETILQFGRSVEAVREARNRRLRERLWPTAGLVAVEEVLRVALAELAAYRAAEAFFLKTARSSGEAVAGGMILQNPWLVRGLPEGAARLTETRAALNRAAAAVNRS